MIGSYCERVVVGEIGRAAEWAGPGRTGLPLVEELRGRNFLAALESEQEQPPAVAEIAEAARQRALIGRRAPLRLRPEGKLMCRLLIYKKKFL